MDQEKKYFWGAVRISGLVIILLWLVHIAQVLMGVSWGEWGVYPRHLSGLKGILTSFWIHGDFGHLISNTTALFVMTGMIFYFYRPVAWRSFVGMYLLTGMLVWVFARESYHIGASGVLYAEVAFVAWIGIFKGDFRSIVLSLLVLMVYGGMFAGIVPTDTKVSWESHLLGSFAGIYMAYIVGEVIPIEKSKEQEARERLMASEDPEKFLFPRNIFEMTKEERAIEEQRRREEAHRRWLEANQVPPSQNDFWRSDHT